MINTYKRIQKNNSRTDSNEDDTNKYKAEEELSSDKFENQQAGINKPNIMESNDKEKDDSVASNSEQRNSEALFKPIFEDPSREDDDSTEKEYSSVDNNSALKSSDENIYENYKTSINEIDGSSDSSNLHLNLKPIIKGNKKLKNSHKTMNAKMNNEIMYEKSNLKKSFSHEPRIDALGN